MTLTRALFLLLLATALLGAPFEREVREREIPLENWLPALAEWTRVDSTGSQGEIATMALPSEASHFIAIAPCRVVDTRRPDGLHGGPILTGGVPRAFNIPSGPCAGIPAASAYSFNIAVTGSAPGSAHFLTAWPAGIPQPLIATLNFNGGQTVSNAALVPADGTGTVEIYASTNTHVILDINGYIAEGVVTSLTAGTGLVGGGSGAVTLGIGAGVVTSLTAGTGLAGGGSGAVTLGISSGGVHTNQLASLAVTDAKLATITAPGKVANSATTATSANVANAIVARDGAGGFAAGALTLSGKVDQTSVDGLVARGTINSGVIPASGAGVRLMWYPRKGAFRAGRVPGTEWDDASTGSYSVATGYGTTASGFGATAMGYLTTASGSYSTAMGLNTTASGNASTARGYLTVASGSYATAMGFQTTASGSSSTAMGRYASTTDAGGTPRSATFVWGDGSTTTPVRPTASNQFVARAAGGVTFYSNSAMSTGVTLAGNGGSWASVSDRNRKSEFLPVDGEQILGRMAALPVASWRYRDDESGRRYIGPVAQDFHALFGLGDDTTLATLDVDGVTLAAVKALEARTTELLSETSALNAENTFLRQELERQSQAHMELQRKLERLETESR
jgi:hypothetical protein